MTPKRRGVAAILESQKTDRPLLCHFSERLHYHSNSR
jgi:hypothetical protein